MVFLYFNPNLFSRFIQSYRACPLISCCPYSCVTYKTRIVFLVYTCTLYLYIYIHYISNNTLTHPSLLPSQQCIITVTIRIQHFFIKYATMSLLKQPLLSVSSSPAITPAIPNPQTPSQILPTSFHSSFPPNPHIPLAPLPKHYSVDQFNSPSHPLKTFPCKLAHFFPFMQTWTKTRMQNQTMPSVFFKFLLPYIPPSQSDTHTLNISSSCVFSGINKNQFDVHIQLS